jgi:glycosyltransferase involved in cell wall biosynthesis
MKILLSVHLYPPTHCAGGEMYLHNMAKFLISQGHKVRVLLNEAAMHNIKQVYIYEDVEVFPRLRNLEEHFIWADRVITHLGYTSWTVAVAHVFKRPVFFVVHNTHHYPCVSDAQNRVGIIYNCEAAKDKLNYPQPNIVLHPPVDYRKYDLGQDPIKNKYITLINLNENKGGHIFWQIARAMPDRQFLAVKGGYDEQIIEELPNVTVLEHTSDILPIYAQTRILLMPSEYESWGMTATEAMCNGIPVVCTQTFGLKENCGDAGIYIGQPPEVVPGSDAWPRVRGRDKIEDWIKAIRKLDEKKYYLHQSKLSRERSRQLDPAKEYEVLLNFVTGPSDPKYIC